MNKIETLQCLQALVRVVKRNYPSMVIVGNLVNDDEYDILGNCKLNKLKTFHPVVPDLYNPLGFRPFNETHLASWGILRDNGLTLFEIEIYHNSIYTPYYAVIDIDGKAIVNSDNRFKKMVDVFNKLHPITNDAL